MCDALCLRMIFCDKNIMYSYISRGGSRISEKGVHIKNMWGLALLIFLNLILKYPMKMK